MEKNGPLPEAGPTQESVLTRQREGHLGMIEQEEGEHACQTDCFKALSFR